MALFANALQEAGHRLSLTESECSYGSILMPQTPDADEFKSYYWGLSMYANPFEINAGMPWILVFMIKAVEPLTSGGGEQLVLTGQLINQIVDALHAL